MFPRINRLPHESLLFLKKSRRFNQGKFVSLLLTENGLDYFRAAVVVPRKAAKNGYIRNRIKRRIRHYMKETLNNELKGYDILVYVKPGVGEVLDADLGKLDSDLKEIATRADIIKVIQYV